MTQRNNLLLRWRNLSMLLKLIILNVIVFVVIRVSGIFYFGHESPLVGFLSLPPSYSSLALKPWAIITYMFTQVEIMHLIFNMLWLYWFGSILLLSVTPRQLSTLYLIGGIAGALIFLSLSPLLYFHGPVIGASASVMSVVAAAGILLPDVPLRLFLIGYVRLKWVAIVTVILFAIGLTGTDAASHIVHLGGLTAGVIFGWQMRRGVDITAPFSAVIDRLFSHPSSPSARRSEPSITDVMAKVRRSGYASLNDEERRILLTHTRDRSDKTQH